MGIEAPTNAPVHREEIYQKILEENRLAAQIGVADFDQIVSGKE